MLGRVRRRQRHRDHEGGARKPEQSQHHQLAVPARQEPLQHGDRALADEERLRDLRVDRQRPKEGEEHEDRRRKRRERARGNQRDPRLVAQRGEVIDTRQPEHQIPRRAASWEWPASSGLPPCSSQRPSAVRGAGRCDFPAGGAGEDREWARPPSTLRFLPGCCAGKTPRAGVLSAVSLRVAPRPPFLGRKTGGENPTPAAPAAGRRGGGPT